MQAHPGEVSLKFIEEQTQIPRSPLPISTPKSKSALWGPRKAFGAPFARNERSG